MNLKIKRNYNSFVQNFEIVERKGFGHPDTICDNLSENIANTLNKRYLEIFGNPQHFNIDKTLLVAGTSETKFGGGQILKPMKFVIGDRAVLLPNNEVEIICKKEVDKITTNFPRSKAIVQVELHPASIHLQEVFKQKLCNDTSAVIGYAPMSGTEKLALETEEILMKMNLPYVGRDIKVMAVRKEDTISIILAIAFIDKYIQSLEDYNEKINYVLGNLRQKTGVNDIQINPDGLYITVTGTSAECGDSGEVGRGNRYNGIIPLCRPMNSEAYHGKNAITHIGKIYNRMAFELAEEIVEIGAIESYVWMYGIIGKPVNDPNIIVSYFSHFNLDKEIQKLMKEELLWD